MKTKEKKDLFTKTEKELKKLLKEANETLLNFVMENKQNKLKNTRQIFWKRKEIAWILTALREKALVIKEVKEDKV